MISAGRVLLMPKGDYDPTATYEMLDIVSYNGSSYIAKGTTTGNLPTNTTYWQLSAYGGQAANLAGNFAPLETTDYASRSYAIDDIFVDKSSQLVIATTTINIGDEIEIGSNCDVTAMAELLDAIENRYDALDQRNRKLVGINPITIQTDLHLLAPGEYFKKLTNFYVTNAPTGINQVPTAVFRLTVESGLDESGSSLLLTLRTIEGEIYTQAYDGSVWSDWKKTGDIADVPTYTGATSITSGVKGLVPAAAAAEKDNYLKGDGTWGALGTAAAKNATDTITSGSADLIESGAVYTAMQNLTEATYNINDSALTEIASDDLVPVYDTSGDEKKNITVNNIIGQTVSNPNLLDNPWFTVNQRGQSTYSTTENAIYTVDRWSMLGWSGKTVSFDVDDSGITFSAGVNSFRQTLNDIWDALVGKKLTLSIEYTSTEASGQIGIIKNNSWDANAVIQFKTGHNVDSVTFTAESGTNPILWVYIPETNTDFNIKAVKLELGSVSTLAMDIAPNYATELLKCQRYFYSLKNSATQGGYITCSAIADSTGTIDFDIPLPVGMRTTPTLSFDSSNFPIGYTQTSVSAGVLGTGLSYIGPYLSNGNIACLRITGTFTQGEKYKIYEIANGHIDFSAEL